MEICNRKGCIKPALINPYRGHKAKYCSIKCSRIHYVDVYRKRKKQELLDLLGGKCSACGYDKCIGALEFHHLDPSKKDFTINSGINLNSQKVLNEVKKCIILCSNCHRELHQSERFLEEIQQNINKKNRQTNQ